MKEIKNYIHLYLGCQAQWSDARNPDEPKVIGELIEIGNNMATIETEGFEFYECSPFEVKPILRPLSSMTEDEKWDFLSFIGYDMLCHIDDVNDSFLNMSANDKDRFAPEAYYNATRWFLSKHFDLFGLIEAGLAIDATQIPTS